MREAGQDCYVMMRPQEHEMKLPARLFRWRGFEGGPEVTTFRIARAYTTWSPDAADQIRRRSPSCPRASITRCASWASATTAAGRPRRRSPGSASTGTTSTAANWSSPRRSDSSTRSSRRSAQLPLVTGELQYHAIGCYTVHRPVKVGVRRSEHLLRQAEIALQHDPQPEPQAAERICGSAWKQVVFHHFHDTLRRHVHPFGLRAGRRPARRTPAASLTRSSSTPSVASWRDLPDDPLQRIVLFNASDRPFNGYAVIEPWMAWRGWQPTWRLIDEQGKAPLQQAGPSEAVVNGLVRLIAKVYVEPGQIRVLRIDESGAGGRVRPP